MYVYFIKGITIMNYYVQELETFFHAGGDGLLMTKIRTEEYKVQCIHIVRICVTTSCLIKKTCELLSLQGSTDDELIAYHLRTLAKWTVRYIDSTYKTNIWVVFLYREKERRRMVNYSSVLGTFRIKEYWKLPVLCSSIVTVNIYINLQFGILTDGERNAIQMLL